MRPRTTNYDSENAEERIRRIELEIRSWNVNKDQVNNPVEMKKLNNFLDSRLLFWLTY